MFKKLFYCIPKYLQLLLIIPGALLLGVLMFITYGYIGMVEYWDGTYRHWKYQ